MTDQLAPRPCSRIVGLNVTVTPHKVIRCGMASTYMTTTVDLTTGWSVADFLCKGCAILALRDSEGAAAADATTIANL